MNFDQWFLHFPIGVAAVVVVVVVDIVVGLRALTQSRNRWSNRVRKCGLRSRGRDFPLDR